MAYGNYEQPSTNFLLRAKVKFLRSITTFFPLNSVRVKALRYCGFSVGKEVYVGPSFLLASTNTTGECHLTIEDRVAIGPRVTIVLASDANWSRLNAVYPPVRGRVHIKNDCWIGAGAIVLPDITIGEYSIVGAGAVVTSNVPPYSIVAGVPAKVIKKINKEIL